MKATRHRFALPRSSALCVSVPAPTRTNPSSCFDAGERCLESAARSPATAGFATAGPAAGRPRHRADIPALVEEGRSLDLDVRFVASGVIVAELALDRIDELVGE